MPSDKVIQISFHAPSSQEPGVPPPCVLFQFSRRTGSRVLGNRRAANFPLTSAGKKERNSLGLLRREAGEPWPSGRWVASLVAPGTFPIAIWNKLEIDAEQLVQTFLPPENRGSPALSKQLLSTYSRPAGSRLRAFGLCFLLNTQNSQ